MQATAVKPPATAAAVPVAIVSLCVWPGLAQVDVHVDEARRDDRARRLDDARVAGVEVLADRA